MWGPQNQTLWLTSLPAISLSNQVTQQACRQFTGDTAENQEVLETGAACLCRTWSRNMETGLQYLKHGVRFQNGNRRNSAKSFPVCASCWPIKDSDGLWSSQVAYGAFSHRFSSNTHSYLTASAEYWKKLRRVNALIVRHTGNVVESPLFCDNPFSAVVFCCREWIWLVCLTGS